MQQIDDRPLALSIPHLLVVDDDRDHRILLSRLLQENGFRVSLANDSGAMLRLIDEATPDLVILDLMLPDEDGLTLCRRLRADSDLPIIILTALGRGPHKVAGLDMGADDYIAKPFDGQELLARIRAVLRRARSTGRAVTTQSGGFSGRRGKRGGKRVYRFEGWRVDTARREVRSPRDVLISLTSAEFDLLMALLEHPQMILTREHLVELTRQRGSDGTDRSIDILISRIRRKIENNSRTPTIIKTVRSGGYLFAPQVQLGD